MPVAAANTTCPLHAAPGTGGVAGVPGTGGGVIGVMGTGVEPAPTARYEATKPAAVTEESEVNWTKSDVPEERYLPHLNFPCRVCGNAIAAFAYLWACVQACT